MNTNNSPHFRMLEEYYEEYEKKMDEELLEKHVKEMKVFETIFIHNKILRLRDKIEYHDSMISHHNYVIMSISSNPPEDEN